jgi:hypothetical protein
MSQKKMREDGGDSQTFRETIVKVADVVGRQSRSLLEDEP